MSLTGFLLRGFGPAVSLRAPPPPEPCCGGSAPTNLVSLSKEVAAKLSAAFPVTARHNSQVVYQTTELSDLHVDVYPMSFGLEPILRKTLSNDVALHIVVQQRAATQEVEDMLSQMCCEMLTFILRKRYQNNALFSMSGSFIASNVFDKLVQYKENVFQSIMEINFRRFQ